jgi:hypothetical protein
MVPTLAALVPGSAAGLVREVILVDPAPSDMLRTIADHTGCELVETPGARGRALAEGAGMAKSDWLMFLRPGAVLDAGWIDEIAQFLAESALTPRGQPRAALFRFARSTYDAPRPADALRAFMRLVVPSPDQGLVIARSFYRDIGGHRASAMRSEEQLLRKIGRARRMTLRTKVHVAERKAL